MKVLRIYSFTVILLTVMITLVTRVESFQSFQHRNIITRTSSLNNRKLNKFQRKFVLRESLEDTISNIAIEAIGVLEDAALPASPSDLISIVFSESVAGFISGVSFIIVSSFAGDKQKSRDTAALTTATSSAYFGLRSAVRNIAQIVGIPKVSLCYHQYFYFDISNSYIVIVYSLSQH